MNTQTLTSMDQIVADIVDYRGYCDAIKYELIDRGMMSAGKLAEMNAQMDALTDGLMDSITICMADK